MLHYIVIIFICTVNDLLRYLGYKKKSHISTHVNTLSNILHSSIDPHFHLVPFSSGLQTSFNFSCSENLWVMNYFLFIFQGILSQIFSLDIFILISYSKLTFFFFQYSNDIALLYSLVVVLYFMRNLLLSLCFFFWIEHQYMYIFPLTALQIFLFSLVLNKPWYRFLHVSCARGFVRVFEFKFIISSHLETL